MILIPKRLIGTEIPSFVSSSQPAAFRDLLPEPTNLQWRLEPTNDLSGGMRDVKLAGY